jgi:hypothetical protein
MIDVLAIYGPLDKRERIRARMLEIKRYPVPVRRR